MLISAVYVIAAYVMLEDSGVVYLNDFIQALIAVYPLLLVGMTAIHCFYFIYDNESMAVAVWAIIMVFVPRLISIAGRRISVLGKVSWWLPWNIMESSTFDESTNRIVMIWNSPEGFIRCFIVGVIGVVFFYALGLVNFKKKEIK